MRAIADVAQFVTSKNAGPFLLTLDIVFPDEASYRMFTSLRALDRHVIAGLYNVPETDVLDIIEFDPAYAVKVTMRRPLGSGALGETDVYGAQQHVPLMSYEIDWPTPSPSQGEGRGEGGHAAIVSAPHPALSPPGRG